MKASIKKIIIWKLALISKVILWRYKPYVIAIAGSVGKTSTKDAIFQVLKSAGYNVRKSEKSYNSEIGLPLTIIGVENPWSNIFDWLQVLWKGFALCVLPNDGYPKYLVVETGVGKPGDMQHIASIIKPNISVLTNLPETPVHVEFFASRDDLWAEKVSLLVHTKPEGLRIANAIDPNVKNFVASQMPAGSLVTWYNDAQTKNVHYLTYAYVKNFEGLPCVQTVFRINDKEYQATFAHIVAPYALDAFLPALCIADKLSISMTKAVQSLEAFVPPPGRMRTFAGINESIIIDDTYNASPVATQKAIETLYDIGSGHRKIAVLGDMLELGEHTQKAHSEIGQYAVQKVDVLVCVGLRSRAMYDAAFAYAHEHSLDKVDIRYVLHPEDMLKTFAFEIVKGDCVLVKGSQGMRMERLTKQLLANDKDAQFLCRQDAEWKKR